MTREEFTERFRAAVEGMSWDDIASTCHASLPTVKRWHDGTVAPHRVGRDSVFAALAKR